MLELSANSKVLKDVPKVIPNEIPSPIMKSNVLPKKLIKACEKVQKMHPFTVDAGFYIPFILNGVGVLSIEVASGAVFCTDLVYRVANVTTSTEKLLNSSATKKKIEKYIEDYKERNKKRDYIVEENKKLKIDEKAIERRERFLDFALKDRELRKDFRTKMENELLEIREYIVNLNIKKKINKILRDSAVRITGDSLNLVGDGVICAPPLWLWGVAIKLTGSFIELSFSGTKKIIRIGREKAYKGKEGNFYSKIFNAKKSKIEKYKRLSKDVETIKLIQKKVEENKLSDEQQKERFNEYIKFYGENLDALLLKKKSDIQKDASIFDDIFIKHADPNFDVLFFTGETLEQNKKIGKPTSQFMQRGFLVGMLTREVYVLEKRLKNLKENRDKIKQIQKEIHSISDTKREREFIRFLDKKTKKEKKYLKNKIGNDLMKISGDLTRFSGAFGTPELNLAGMFIRLVGVFLDLAIVSHYEKATEKDVSKYVNLIQELCNIVEVNNDAEVEKRLREYLDIIGCKYDDVMKIRDIDNRKDYIKNIILGTL